MPKRTRLATGIYADAYGRSVIYHAHGTPIETRFPVDKPLDLLIRWRKRQIGQHAELKPREPRGSLARDAVLYLKRLKGQPGYKSERAHLRAWLHRFPGWRRWTLTREHVELAIADWRQQGYAARTIRHRCRVLESLCHRLDGDSSVTPCDHVTIPAKPKPRPVSIPDVTIAAVALELRKHEIAGTLRSAKTRARFLVLATHAQRPAELQRTKREDVDLERRLWATRGAKGGYSMILPLNADQVAAWQLFATARAWGAYDMRSFARTLYRAGWPKTIRPYNLRHSTGIALSTKNVDLGDIQALMGHTSPETTRTFYVPGQRDRLEAAAQKIDGRFPAMAFAPLPRRTPTRRQRQAAKARELAGKSDVA